MPLFTFPSVWNSAGYEKHDTRHNQFIKHVSIAPVHSTLISLYNCTPLQLPTAHNFKRSFNMVTATLPALWGLDGGLPSQSQSLA